ncbi:hypothetical protein AB0F81_12785 [Actinoplanes sp. NPDC024001]|uniref:hypothetical protein n=1 Tax=Actinoplanes sp. NPDC024001 TaxID=3154598 RepID=UPI00340D23DC
MYARVAIASNALPTPGLPAAVANALHQAAVEGLHAHGRLVFGSNGDAVELIKAVQSGPGLPPDARRRWSEMLIHLAKIKRITISRPDTVPVASINALADLRQHWGGHADVAVVAAEACEPLGVPVDEWLLTDTGQRPDVATTATVPQCSAIKRLRGLADHATAPRGSSRDQFWRDVLEPLATGAQQATVVDRYLFKALWDLTTGKHWTTGWRGEHLGWLLRRLDAVMGASAEVRLIGAASRDHPTMTAERTADALRTLWAPESAGRLARVTITLAAPGRPASFPHDRHIRFSTGGAVLLAAGFDRLRAAVITDEDGMNWQYRWSRAALQELTSTERRAAALPGAGAVVLERPAASVERTA